MAKKIIEKSDILLKYDDGSLDVVCKGCGEWKELKADDKGAIKIQQIEGSEKDYLCLGCWYKSRADKEIQRVDEIRLGQAINLSVQELTRNGVEITAEKVKAKVRFYLPLIKEIQEEHKNGN